MSLKETVLLPLFTKTPVQGFKPDIPNNKQKMSPIQQPARCYT